MSLAVRVEQFAAVPRGPDDIENERLSPVHRIGLDISFGGNLN